MWGGEGVVGCHMHPAARGALLFRATSPFCRSNATVKSTLFTFLKGDAAHELMPRTAVEEEEEEAHNRNRTRRAFGKRPPAPGKTKGKPQSSFWGACVFCCFGVRWFGVSNPAVATPFSFLSSPFSLYLFSFLFSPFPFLSLFSLSALLSFLSLLFSLFSLFPLFSFLSLFLFRDHRRIDIR